MQTYALGTVATGLMAVVTLPIAFGIARLCLNGVLHLIKAGRRE